MHLKFVSKEERIKILISLLQTNLANNKVDTKDSKTGVSIYDIASGSDNAMY